MLDGSNRPAPDPNSLLVFVTLFSRFTRRAPSNVFVCVLPCAILHNSALYSYSALLISCN